MSPDLISFAFRSLLRLGRAGNSALSQHARDKDVIFPALVKPKANLRAFVAGFFADPKNEHWVAQGAVYAEFWSPQGPNTADPQAVDALYIAIVKIQSEEGVDAAKAVSANAEAAAGEVMISQWADGTGPVGPLVRVLVTIADIALEYVAQDPSIIGGDERSEKLLGAFALSLSKSLPDDGKFGPKHRFAERLFAVALRASLETVVGNTEIIVSEAHIEKLLDKSLPPIIDSLPTDISKRLDRKRAVEAISGPALSAAFGVIAEHSEAFLGSDFKSTEAVGALTQAVLELAADEGISELLADGGLNKVYRAALNVAATRPELFVGHGNRSEDDVARQLLSKFADVLQQDGNDRAIGPQLGAAVLEVIQSNVHLYLDSTDQWESLAADLLSSVLEGLSSAVLAGDKDRLSRVFSRDQVVSLVKVVLNQVAATPSMIASGNAEVTRLVGIVASLVAQDDDLLLTADDWLGIASIVAAEAAANPGRLFHIDGNDPNKKLVEEMIALVLQVASSSFNSAGRVGGAVLFGPTLREAIVILVTATAGNAAAAKENLGAIRALVQNISDFVIENKDSLGSKEWLAIFRQLLIVVLSGETAEELTMDMVDAILSGELT